MKSKLLFLFFVICLINGQSQNLVINSGFEYYSVCPTNNNDINVLVEVYNPNLSSPDIFSSCCGFPTICGQPNNYIGEQIPKNDSSYLGLVYNVGQYYEYITLKLSSPLQADKIYSLDFFTSLAENCKYALNNFGAYLHINLINQNDYNFLNFTPHINTIDFITDTLNWVEISGLYEAIGGEEYITIGSFGNNADTLAMNNLPTNTTTNYNAAYYYIDAVSVVEIKDTTVNNTLLFPNPNNGIFSLNYNLENESHGLFEIYNELGQIVYEQKLTQNNGTANFELNLAAGMYFCQLRTNTTIILTDKFIIQ